MQNLEGYLNTYVVEIFGKYLQTSKFNSQNIYHLQLYVHCTL